MASGLFIGLTECELLDIKAKALAMIMEGKTLMSYSDSGSSASKQFAMPPKEMLGEAMYALSKLDPQTYGKSTTVIVNLFGSKAGLIQAVGEEALRQDAAFHAAFFAPVAGLPPSRDALLALLRHYLRLRASDSAGFARIWEALLIDGDACAERRDLIRRWAAMREIGRAHV